jgi:hypothetical protein
MIVVNGQPTKDVNPKTAKSAKKVQAVVLLCLVGLFLLTSYSLFEAYWTGEVLGCGRGSGCRWTSYQNSPVVFVVVVILDALLFLLFGFAVGACYRQMVEKQDSQRG